MAATAGASCSGLGRSPARRRPIRRSAKSACASARGNRARSCGFPPDWLSGVYVGKLVPESEGPQSYVVFIVRDDRPADFIFQCSDNTWQAYNRWPSQFALYDDGYNKWYWGGGVQVSYRRPYGKYCQIMDAPLSTGSGEFFLWEFPFAFWLESLGYDVTYISNPDTHTDAAGLRRARGFLSVGHDEYWSIEMFENVRAAIASGVSVGFFSGNAVCGRVLFNEHNERLRARRRLRPARRHEGVRGDQHARARAAVCERTRSARTAPARSPAAPTGSAATPTTGSTRARG